ncbi:hypothetical protein ACU5AY_05970 [Rhizobium sp. PAMB 3174]
MDAKDWAPWVGIAASLLWNLVNSYRTSALWRRGQLFAEFKGLKGPVETTLASMREAKSELTSLAAFGGSDDDFRENLEAFNHKLSNLYVSLTTALEALDSSDFNEKTNWVSMTERSWDDAVGAVQRIYAPMSLTDKKALIGPASEKLGKLIELVSKEVERETKKQLEAG